MLYIIGHKNPDTDSIVSAIVWGKYKKSLGIKAVIGRAGDLNKETEFVLKTFRALRPVMVKKVKKSDKLIIVDHNIYRQAVSGAENAEIVEVLDHHYIGDFRTEKPIYYRAEPVGSTATIIAEIFRERKYKPTKTEAGLLLGGIISDTLFLASPTTSEIDREMVKFLNRIARLDLEKFAGKMFKSKSDISGLGLPEILFTDYKEFGLKSKKVGIGVWETVDVSPFDSRKEEIVKILRREKKKRQLDLLFFGLVDIYKRELFMYLAGDYEKEVAEKAFGGKVVSDSLMFVKGVVSRKKQMVPAISKVVS